MKNVTTFLISLLLVQILAAQKHDYVWITGDNNSLADTTKGGSTIDFNFNPPKVYYNYRELNMFVCNSSICDTAGKLMFYTNGCDIAGSDDEIIENGETINPGEVHQIKCDQENDGYTAGYQSTIILPVPDSNKLFYLFHKRIIYTNNPFGVKTDKLFYSIVDMNANSGVGTVVEKNVEIMSSYLAYGEMTAVKHANGKDWWLITPKDDGSTFYFFLFTNKGIVDTLTQTIGTSPPPNASGGIQMVFSPDGNQLFRSIPSGAVMVYNFNRLNGFFSNFDTIHVDYGNWPSVANGCAVSPNGRFLYVSAELRIYQFDLWSDNISASQITVAEWDGFKDPVGTLFGQCQLAPDCKIYISTIDAKYYHVINNPDELGLSCNVTQHSFIFPTPTGASIPSFPNYRLGPMDNPGVPCTATVSAGNPPPTPLPPVSVFPNPAVSYLKVIVNRPLPVGAQWRLRDAFGRVVHAERLVNEATCTEIAVEGLATGVYFWELKGKDGAVVQSGKIFKQ
ncbi:MAG: T9SS C-terminal target domain-containing protein [Haliscomenobacteraceae bacterium CHB4]|nr:hypothetical protein [Saprospiraceae bacterium]MCE7926357.1 T9SS C-terminal target domain-containing protein [Haliscomenobacteraceae bacterium CHB4]